MATIEELEKENCELKIKAAQINAALTMKASVDRLSGLIDLSKEHFSGSKLILSSTQSMPLDELESMIKRANHRDRRELAYQATIELLIDIIDRSNCEAG